MNLNPLMTGKWDGCHLWLQWNPTPKPFVLRIRLRETDSFPWSTWVEYRPKTYWQPVPMWRYGWQAQAEVREAHGEWQAAAEAEFRLRGNGRPGPGFPRRPASDVCRRAYQAGGGRRHGKLNGEIDRVTVNLDFGGGLPETIDMTKERMPFAFFPDRFAGQHPRAMTRLLYVPVDFQHRDEVRTLAALLPDDNCCGLVFRLWLDWARSDDPVCPFRNPQTAACLAAVAQDFLGPRAVVLVNEPLVTLIEDYVGWRSPYRTHRPCLLVECVIAAGVLLVAAGGLELCGFVEHNAHLAPKFESQYAKGGRRKAHLRRLQGIGAAVPKQMQLMQSAGRSLPDAATEAEQRRSVRLIINLSCACGRLQRRPQDYPDTLLRAALVLVRARDDESLGELILAVRELRNDPSANLDPDLILHREATSAASDAQQKATKEYTA